MRVFYPSMIFMVIDSYLLYLNMSIIASISLGPSVLMAASNGINYGRKKALFGVFCHVSAMLILAIISASGLGFIVMASEHALTVLKYAGAAYLIYLGLRILSCKNNRALANNNAVIPSKRILFKQSFSLGISNPKALIFFSALFPQFIQVGQPLLPQFFILAGTSLINAFAFTFAYALLAYQCKGYLLRTMNSGWLDRITGGMFIGFAGFLATS